MSRVTYGSRPYYCVIFAGYVDPTALLPGVHLGQYGVFFWASSMSKARRMRKRLEWKYKCRLGDPEIYTNQIENKPDPIKLEKSLPTNQFPELFFEL